MTTPKQKAEKPKPDGFIAISPTMGMLQTTFRFKEEDCKKRAEVFSEGLKIKIRSVKLTFLDED